MLTKEQLKRAIHSPGVPQNKQVLMCLAFESDSPKSVSEIRTIGSEVGLKGAKKANISAILGQQSTYAIRTTNGWELTDLGRQEVSAWSGVASKTAPTSELRKLLPRLGNTNTGAFLEEAVEAAELHHYRSAVVLSWVGAVALLQEAVINGHLHAFNSEASRRDNKWRNAKTADDLSRMKEFEFLQVIASVSVIGPNVKTQLEGCLKLRNACGHPNSLKIGESNVNAHIETLALNVYEPFS